MLPLFAAPAETCVRTRTNLSTYRTGVQRMRLVLVQVALVLVLLCDGAQAADPDGNYTVLGIGNRSCGHWTVERGTKSNFIITAWVGGFVSGVGSSGKGFDPAHNLDGDAIWAWVDNYCHAHPLETIGGASAAFVRAHPR